MILQNKKIIKMHHTTTKYISRFLVFPAHTNQKAAISPVTPPHSQAYNFTHQLTTSNNNSADPDSTTLSCSPSLCFE